MKKDISEFTIGIFLILAFLFPSFLFRRERGITDELKYQKNQIEKELIKHKAFVDSLSNRNIELEKEFKKLTDQYSLQEKETAKAKLQVTKWKKKYEEINFVPFASDSIRRSEISRLYPSAYH